MTAAVLIPNAGRYGADLYQPTGLRLSGRKREGNGIADLLQMQRGWGVRNLLPTGGTCGGRHLRSFRSFCSDSKWSAPIIGNNSAQVID